MTLCTLDLMLCLAYEALSKTLIITDQDGVQLPHPPG